MIISTLLSLIGIFLAGYSLPEKWMTNLLEVKSSYAILATCLGLVSGLMIGFSTNYYTSYDFRPV